MQEHLLDQLLDRLSRPQESEAAVLRRLRVADSRLTRLYASSQVVASGGYADPVVRGAYLLRYLPHYTLQLGDLLRSLEGFAEVAELLTLPRLRHVALCGGPAPEAIALAVLHAQAGGQRLHTTVLDRQAQAWSDCWPISHSIACSFSGHPALLIDGRPTDLAQPPSAAERALLAGCQVLTLMNAWNELIRLGGERLRRTLAARLAALPPGALVLCSDQAFYEDSRKGMALLRDLLHQHRARFLINRTARTDVLAMANRFPLAPRLRAIYGRSAGAAGPATNHYRIWNRQLQLAAILPDRAV